MKSYHPAKTDDEVIREVWRIKDDTVKQFSSVAEYVKSLHSKTPNTTLPGKRQKRRTPEH